MEKNVQVRYSRVYGYPKNTLITIRDGDTIYFGISRCNTSKDLCRKEFGKKIALARATSAMNNNYNVNKINNSLEVHPVGNFGKVAVSDVLDLLKYFEGLDR